MTGALEEARGGLQEHEHGGEDGILQVGTHTDACVVSESSNWMCGWATPAAPQNHYTRLGVWTLALCSRPLCTQIPAMESQLKRFRQSDIQYITDNGSFPMCAVGTIAILKTRRS